MVAADSGQARPPAPPPVRTYTLTVKIQGVGVVTSTPAGLHCTTGACGVQLPNGTVVTLTPSGGVFRRWSGGCSGSGACTVKITGNRSVTAQFR